MREYLPLCYCPLLVPLVLLLEQMSVLLLLPLALLPLVLQLLELAQIFELGQSSFAW